jgi:hypothetical protein
MTEIRMTSAREDALARIILEAIEKKVVPEDYGDEEIFTALLMLVCGRILKENEGDRATTIDRVTKFLRANCLLSSPGNDQQH